jgi:hypothetical protein
VSSFTTIELGDLVRVLNKRRDLVCWTSKELADRHIEFGDGRWEMPRKQKHRVLIWPGKELVPMGRIVVRLWPGHSKAYERLVTREIAAASVNPPTSRY